MSNVISLPNGALLSDSESVLSRILSKHVSFVAWNRSIDWNVCKQIEKFEWNVNYPLEFNVNFNFPHLFVAELDARMKVWGVKNQFIKDWVFNDILSVLSIFFKTTEAENVQVSISTIDQIDFSNIEYNKHLRLVTTYGKDGLGWSNDQLNFGMDIRPFDVVIQAGKAWPGKRGSFFNVVKTDNQVGKTTLVMQIEYLN